VLVFTDAVLNWGEPRLRDLPWRRTRDPWKVLVSEVMLQQTQVDRVIPKWLAFIERFPDPASCAAATLADVLRIWQGLGYPRRARNLHLAAQHVVDRGGEFPDTLDALLTLPGVGAYTARAVLAFAFESDAAVVDTNIARVYARVSGRPLTLREVQYTADAYLPAGESWVWNQTVMDLGAVLCRPSSPRCDDCPVVGVCSWHGVGVDPAQGSAAVSRRQARFEGSDRQARGRLLKALTDGPVPLERAAAVMQRPADDAARLVDDLVREGLCAQQASVLTLPV
jgi:A/G-specific adenine glycosylase